MYGFNRNKKIPFELKLAHLLDPETDIICQFLTSWARDTISIFKLTLCAMRRFPSGGSVMVYIL